MRLAHWSDLHITWDPRQLPLSERLGKRFAAWVNLLLLGRYARFAEAAGIARALVADLERERPDAIVFSGDVTGQGLERELERASDLLLPLLDDPRVVGIPGNHDAYTEAAWRGRRFSRWFGRWERSDLPDLAMRGSPYPLVRLLGPAWAVLAIDVARPRPPWDSSGEAGCHQLACLERALLDRRLGGRRTLLVVHYAPRRHDGQPDTRLHGMRDAERLLELAARHRVAAILCGHLHRRFALAAGPATPVPILCAGSVSDARRARAYHVYDLDGTEPRLEVRRFDPATGAFAADPALGGPLPLGEAPGEPDAGSALGGAAS